MIIIHYATLNETVQSWKEILEDLVIEHKLEATSTLFQPILKNGSEKIEGVTEISKYVESLKEYQQSWFDCACG